MRKVQCISCGCEEEYYRALLQGWFHHFQTDGPDLYECNECAADLIDLMCDMCPICNESGAHKHNSNDKGALTSPLPSLSFSKKRPCPCGSGKKFNRCCAKF